MAKKSMNKLPIMQSRLNKVIPVCGRKFKVFWADGNIGAQFNTIHPQTGGGTILLGKEPKDEYYQLTNVVHEILEIVLTLRGHRWKEEDDRILFSMNHDDFVDVCLDLSRSLIDTGLIQVNETGEDVKEVEKL